MISELLYHLLGWEPARVEVQAMVRRPSLGRDVTSTPTFALAVARNLTSAPGTKVMTFEIWGKPS